MTKEEKIREQEALASCKYFKGDAFRKGIIPPYPNPQNEREYEINDLAMSEAMFVRMYVPMKNALGINPFPSYLDRYEKSGLTHFMENDGRLMCFKAFFLCVLNKDGGSYEAEAQTFKEFYCEYYG